MNGMLYNLSRVLQFVGLIVLPCAISGNLAEKLTLWQSLSMAAVGVCIFYVGWSLQQTVGPR